MLLDDVGTFVASAANLTLGTNLFLSLMPDQPDDCTVIYEFTGMAPAYSMGRDLPAIEMPRIQVVCRSTSYSSARTRIDSIWQALQGIRDETLTATTYLAFTALGSPEPLARDASQRERIGATFQVWK